MQVLWEQPDTRLNQPGVCMEEREQDTLGFKPYAGRVHGWCAQETEVAAATYVASTAAGVVAAGAPAPAASFGSGVIRFLQFR